MSNLTPFSKLLLKENVPDATVFYLDEGIVTWQQFCRDISAAIAKINLHTSERWLLFCEDAYLFTVGLLALTQCKKSIVISSSLQPGSLNAIAEHFDMVLTDIDSLDFAHELIGKKNTDEVLPHFTEVDSQDITLTLFTSGSTGTPAPITKTLAAYEKEIETLFMMWRDTHSSGVTLSSVPHYHAYGFVFGLLWPLSRGASVLAERIKYPEQLLAYLDQWAVTLISSPAFLRRWAEVWEEQEPPRGTILQILSAGGELPQKVTEKIATKTGKAVREIYGSTETGAVAFRNFPQQEWQLINGISATVSPSEGRLSITSPYALATQGVMTSDKAKLLPNGRFILQGRIGNIVKIEEKRLSIQEMVACCRKLPYFDEINIIALQAPKKQMLGVVSTLSLDGKDALEQRGKYAFVQEIKAHLRHYFEPVLIPRKWRFVEALPRNEMGKVIYNDLLSLF